MPMRATCFECGANIDVNDAGMGMNIPDVTPGPVYWCVRCKPPTDEEGAKNSLSGFIDPPREKC